MSTSAQSPTRGGASPTGGEVERRVFGFRDDLSHYLNSLQGVIPGGYTVFERERDIYIYIHYVIYMYIGFRVWVKTR